MYVNFTSLKRVLKRYLISSVFFALIFYLFSFISSYFISFRFVSFRRGKSLQDQLKVAYHLYFLQLNSLLMMIQKQLVRQRSQILEEIKKINLMFTNRPQGIDVHNISRPIYYITTSLRIINFFDFFLNFSFLIFSASKEDWKQKHSYNMYKMS